MLTIIMLYVGTKVMEFVIEGLNPKRPLQLFLINQMKLPGR